MRYITSVEQIGYDREVEAEAQRSREQLLEAQRSIERLLERERLMEAQRSMEREQSLILRLLKRKVGPINDRSLTEINTLSIEQLESLGEALLDFGSIDELTSWLETQG